MTAYCSGGTSSPNPSAPSQAAFTVAAVDVLLTSAELWWLIPFVSAYEAPLLNIGTMCAVDPPAAPTITADDLAALLNPWLHPGSSATVAKIDQLIKRLAWIQFCKCDSIATPPLSKPVVTQPANPPVVIDGTSGLCAPMLQNQCRVLDLWNGTTNVAPPTGWDQPSFDDSAWKFSAAPVMPVPMVNVGSAAGGFGFSPACLPVASCTPQAIAPWVTPPTGKEQFLIRWRFNLPSFDKNKLCISEHFYFESPGAGGWSSGLVNSNGTGQNPAFNLFSMQSVVTGLQAGPNLIAVWVNSSNSGNANTWGPHAWVTMFLTIAGSVGTPSAAGCCPPDPALLQLLQSIIQGVTLIQRQNAPFAYVTGATHPGLSGVGQFAVSGLLGLAVAITTTPGRVGLAAGDPNTLFDVGWLSVGSTDGWLSRKFIRSNPWLWLPDDMGTMTLVGYTIPPDVTVTITELVREP